MGCLDSLPKICGPKLSLCCLFLSVWGILQLGVMGGMFAIHSITLAHTIIPEGEVDLTTFSHDVDDEFGAAMMRCMVTAGVYLLTFALSLVQFCVNKRQGFKAKPKTKKINKKKKGKLESSDFDLKKLEKELGLSEDMDTVEDEGRRIQIDDDIQMEAQLEIVDETNEIQRPSNGEPRASLENAVEGENVSQRDSVVNQEDELRRGSIRTDVGSRQMSAAVETDSGRLSIQSRRSRANQIEDEGGGGEIGTQRPSLNARY